MQSGDLPPSSEPESPTTGSSRDGQESKIGGLDMLSVTVSGCTVLTGGGRRNPRQRANLLMHVCEVSARSTVAFESLATAAA